MFGTDNEPEEKMYANYFRWLEAAAEYLPYWGSPGQRRWAMGDLRPGATRLDP
jgi:hypothetical protein